MLGNNEEFVVLQDVSIKLNGGFAFERSLGFKDIASLLKEFHKPDDFQPPENLALSELQHDHDDFVIVASNYERNRHELRKCIDWAYFTPTDDKQSSLH